MKKTLLILLAMASVAVTPLLSAATLYKWVDEDGKVTYRDTPPPEGVQFEERHISGGQASDDPGASAADNAPITIYTTPNCSSCDSARSYLQKRDVPFQEKNVEGNPDLQKELKEKAGELSVPTILVGPKVMRGFVQSLLEGELDAAGYPKAEAEAPATNEQAPAPTEEAPAPTEEAPAENQQ